MKPWSHLSASSSKTETAALKAYWPQAVRTARSR